MKTFRKKSMDSSSKNLKMSKRKKKKKFDDKETVKVSSGNKIYAIFVIIGTAASNRISNVNDYHLSGIFVIIKQIEYLIILLCIDLLSQLTSFCMSFCRYNFDKFSGTKSASLYLWVSAADVTTVSNRGMTAGLQPVHDWAKDLLVDQSHRPEAMQNLNLKGQLA